MPQWEDMLQWHWDRSDIGQVSELANLFPGRQEGSLALVLWGRVRWGEHQLCTLTLPVRFLPWPLPRVPRFLGLYSLRFVFTF